MIINQDENLVVPDGTIAVFPLIPDEGFRSFDMSFSEFLRPLNASHKRDWFTSHFYRCLPLSIGNMQGFVFSVPYGFDVVWNGGDDVDDLSIHFDRDISRYAGINWVVLSSEFGSGILTMHAPVTLKTPPGINLMTIAPPNFPLPGMSPMTGVVESDNIRFTFTINIKIDTPNTLIRVEKDTPIAGILPIPRYFCDSFSLVSAYDIFDEAVIEEERAVIREHNDARAEANNTTGAPDKMYYRGMDIRGNKFNDHQLPSKKLEVDPTS
jgi:hypothetical protein